MKAVAAALVLLLAAAPGLAQQLRIATFNTELSRDGPGLLLRDIDRGEDPQIAAVIDVITANNADVLLLQGIDWDLENRAVQALRRRLSEAGTDYPHLLSLQPNAGRPPLSRWIWTATENAADRGTTRAMAASADKAAWHFCRNCRLM